MVDVRIMQARKARSHGRITTKNVDFSGDELELSNDEKTKNSSPRHHRSAKELNKRSLLSKQYQTAETLEWLSENYELIQGVCVPRCVLYTHYLDFCKKRKFSPAGPATFGKLIRQRFPKLTTRRLGTRGQSKYHYYGISIKESSVYYHSVYSGKGLPRFSSSEGRKTGMTKKFSFDKKSSNTLPEFPKAAEMILDRGLSVEKVETFIIMYRTHCQRLLDTVMNANFNEVHKFLLHFWRGMPDHMIPVLECDAVVDIIVVCDSLLYKIFSDVLVPSCIQDIPDSLTEEIQDFAITFVNSLEACLENTPARLRSKKLEVAKNFVRLLKRNMTFINLAQTARPVFLSYESMSGILNEFRCLDMRKILSELLFLTEQETVDLAALLMFMEEFENLLVKQAPIEAYAEWFDNIVEEYVLKEEVVNTSDLSKRSQTFLTNWSFITSRILQELTLKGAPTFGSFQLIIMMFEEYILFIIENQIIAHLSEDLKLGLTRHLRKSSEKEANLIQDVSKTQDKQHKQPQPQEDSGKQKQQHSRQPNQETVAHKSKNQQMLLFQDLQQDIQQLQNSEDQQQNSQPQDPYDVQNHSYSLFAQLGVFSQSQTNTPQLPNPPPSNFPIGDAYLGVNAVPTDICRIENISGNRAQNFEFSAQKNGQNTSQNNGHSHFLGQLYAGSASKNQYEAYQISHLSQGQGQSQLGQGQPGQNQMSGHYQVQGQSQNFPGEIEQVLYRDGHQGEGQSSNQGQGHFQGQVHSHDQGFSRTRDQNLFQNHQDLGQVHQGQGHQNQGHQNQGQGHQGQGHQNQGQDHQDQGHQNQGQGHENQGQGHQGQGHQNQGQGYQNQGQGYQSQGHQNQGQSHFKDYQYENLGLICRSQNQVCGSVDHNASLHQNINDCHTSNVCSNYPYTGSMTIHGRHIFQNNNLTYTTHSSCSGQEKTTLPSFIQLSSQLSTNTRLSSGY